jgi:serine-type D-Ala-D-Ala carboxypeptidase/endopeptidase (penicillin-binding protein 4)
MKAGTARPPVEPPPAPPADTPGDRRPWIRGPACRSTLGAAALLAGAGICANAASASPASLRHALESFARGTESSGLQYGVAFFPVAESGKPQAPKCGERNPGDAVCAHGDSPLVPASLAKLPTTAFALEKLGTDFTFTTRLLDSGEQRADTLFGDLVIVGGGDPFLVSERLWLLAREARATGLAVVTGRMVVDGSWLAPGSADPVRSLDREVSDRPYAAKLSALAVDFDAAAVRITPGIRAGLPGTAEADPISCGYLQVDNRLVTGAAGTAEQVTVQLEPDGGGGEIARIEGTLPFGAPARVEYRSVSDPLAFSASMVRAFLAREGIQIAGPTVFETSNSKARLRLQFASLPLRELVAKANRYSNNFMADQIALALSARLAPADDDATTRPGMADSAAGSTPPESSATGHFSSAASLTDAGRWITAYLRESCGAPDGVRQFDGSGLHVGDRLAAETLARLLVRTWTNLGIGPDFAASLAVPGQDGTLRSRFQDGVAPILRGKTGTMSEPLASGFAGYLEASPGKVIAFTILMNASENAGWDLARMKARQEAWVREYLR